jgi:hypothetical protein
LEGVELLQVEAALHRVVAQYAGRPLEWAVKLKVPTDGGLPGHYNGRSYDGLYLIKGGGKKVWKLFPRIRKEWRKPQGISFSKRCGVTQNIGPAARVVRVGLCINGGEFSVTETSMLINPLIFKLM